MNIGTYTNAKKIEEFKVTFEVKVKAFYDKLPDAFALMKELLLFSPVLLTDCQYAPAMPMLFMCFADMKAYTV